MAKNRPPVITLFENYLTFQKESS